MLKEKIINKINHHKKTFKIFFTLFFIIPAIITYFIEPVFAVFSFILYSYIFVYLYMENKAIKGFITVFFVIWLFLYVPITATYASDSDLFNEKVFFILRFIFPIINVILYSLGLTP